MFSIVNIHPLIADITSCMCMCCKDTICITSTYKNCLKIIKTKFEFL